MKDDQRNTFKYMCPSLYIMKLDSVLRNTLKPKKTFDICDPYSFERPMVGQLFLTEAFVTFLLVLGVLYIKNQTYTLRELSDLEIEKIIEIKIQNIKHQLT